MIFSDVHPEGQRINVRKQQMLLYAKFMLPPHKYEEFKKFADFKLPSTTPSNELVP